MESCGLALSITRSVSRIENASWIPVAQSTKPCKGLKRLRLPGPLPLTPTEEPERRPHNRGRRQAQYRAFGTWERVLIVLQSQCAPLGILHVRNSLFSVGK